MFRREHLLIILIVAHASTAENNAQEFLHSFIQVLSHHLKITVCAIEIIFSGKVINYRFFFNLQTEKSTLHNKDILHRVLEQMVHGNMLETRISHITALRDYVS